MQISQKDKTTIIVLLVIMIVAGFYMYGIKPLTEKKEVLETEVKALTTERDEADANYRGVSASTLNNRKAQAEALQIEYEQLKASGETDTGTIIWNGSDEEFKTNYQLLDYMLNDYMVNVLGIVVDSGSVSVTTYTTSGVTKTASMSVTSFKCSSKTALNSLLNEVAKEKSLKIISINWSPDANNANVLNCSMIIQISVAA